MNFKTFSLQIITFLILTNCNQNHNDKNIENNNISNQREYFSFYKRVDSIINVARVIKNSNDKFSLLLYKINTSVSENARQTFNSELYLTKKEIENKKIELQNTYNWKPFEGNQVIFVQIQPTTFKNDFQLLDRRQEIEGKIDSELKSNNCGEWFAGDLGPGGGNMLYTVSDFNKSFEIIMEVLQQNNLDKNIIIARRILIEKNDWFYEVIYPQNFSGNFNSM